jgi:hypothetical protein
MLDDSLSKGLLLQKIVKVPRNELDDDDSEKGTVYVASYLNKKEGKG